MLVILVLVLHKRWERESGVGVISVGVYYGAEVVDGVVVVWGLDGIININASKVGC